MTNQDLQQIRLLIQNELKVFKQQNLAFRAKKYTDTATDKKTATPKSQLSGSYMPIAGGTFTGAIITQDGSAFGSSGAKVGGTNVGFYGTTPATKPTVSGSKGANAALASLMTALAGQGLVTDSTT